MKLNRDFRNHPDAAAADNIMKKAVKLDPIRKSGKDRHTIYRALDDDDEDVELQSLHKRESALDYMDDSEDGDMWEDDPDEEFEEEEEDEEPEEEEY